MDECPNKLNKLLEKQKKFYKPLKYQFEKHVKKGSLQIERKDYKTDLEGRLYRNVSVDLSSRNDEFCAEADLVVPRYLLYFETKYPF